MKRLAVWMSLLSAPLWIAVHAAAPGEPELISLFPFGGQQGAEFRTTVRGRSLDLVTAVWFDCEHLSATVTGVEIDKDAAASSSKKKKKSGSSKAPLQLLSMTVKVAAGAAPGVHSMRLVTARGVSNALPVRVHTEPAIVEAEGRHNEAASAQALPSLPVVVNGKLPGGGELDYYAFEAEAGETLRFDGLASGSGLDPGLTLLEASGSWFSPGRLTELAFNDEQISYPGLPVHARIVHKFAKKGRYFVRVNGFLGEGGTDYAYQLSIRRGRGDDDPMRPAHMPEPSSDVAWQERDWKRELKPDRLRMLWARAVAPEKPVEDVPVLRLGPSEKPVAVQIPVLLEGAIAHPAEIHRVQFHVKEGDRIAVELETMRKTIPEFNPYLRIVSADGDEAFTNVHSTVNTCGDTILKQIQPKTTYSFPREGDFILEIRDITHVYGEAGFAYRVMIRQQAPHMGEVHVSEEQVNLVAGEVTKVSVETDQEEGFDGQIALSVEGLPQGVRAVMGTEVQPQVPPPYNPGKVERFRPESQKATFLLVTDSAAPVTSKPVEVSIVAQPVVKGKLGRTVLVKKILLTVVQSGKS